MIESCDPFIVDGFELGIFRMAPSRTLRQRTIACAPCTPPGKNEFRAESHLRCHVRNPLSFQCKLIVSPPAHHRQRDKSETSIPQPLRRERSAVRSFTGGTVGVPQLHRLIPSE